MNNPKSKRALQKEQKIQEENIKKLDENIKRQKRIPAEYKRKMRNQMLMNVIMAILMIACLIGINILSFYIDTVHYLGTLKVASIIIALLSIIYFELGYQKDSEKLFLCGVEILIFAMMILLSIYLYSIFYGQYTQIINGMAIIVAIYYLIKSMIIHKRMKKQYYKEQNDIREIVKKR